MVIEVLAEKYKVGCNRGMGKIEKKYLLTELNTIIEWKWSSFPKKPKDEQPEEGKEPEYIEDREFLGKQPELKPGDCFLFDGQVIAVDSEERLVLIVSETGGNALERIWGDHIEPEIDLIFNEFPINDVEYEAASKDSIPGNYEITTPPYNIYKIWKDHFVAGRFEDNDDLCIKCTVDSDDLIFPATIYMKKWSVMYDPNEFMDEEQAKNIVHQAISWFYENEYREVYVKPKEPEEKN